MGSIELGVETQATPSGTFAPRTAVTSLSATAPAQDCDAIEAHTKASAANGAQNSAALASAIALGPTWSIGGSPVPAAVASWAMY